MIGFVGKGILGPSNRLAIKRSSSNHGYVYRKNTKVHSILWVQLQNIRVSISSDEIDTKAGPKFHNPTDR